MLENGILFVALYGNPDRRDSAGQIVDNKHFESLKDRYPNFVTGTYNEAAFKAFIAANDPTKKNFCPANYVYNKQGPEGVIEVQAAIYAVQQGQKTEGGFDDWGLREGAAAVLHIDLANRFLKEVMGWPSLQELKAGAKPAPVTAPVAVPAAPAPGVG